MVFFFKKKLNLVRNNKESSSIFRGFQRLATNLTNPLKFQDSNIYEEKSEPTFLARRQEITNAHRTLYFILVFLNDKDVHTIKIGQTQNKLIKFSHVCCGGSVLLFEPGNMEWIV